MSAFEKGLAASLIGAIDDQKVIEALALPLNSSGNLESELFLA